MNFIVYDLEATCWEGNPPNLVQEIIEIGAVKINRYGEETGTFSRFVKPILNPSLSLFCRQLTTIGQSAIDKAMAFGEVVEDFKAWAGVSADVECLFGYWGRFDRKMLF